MGLQNWTKLDKGGDSHNPSRPEKLYLTHSRNLGVHNPSQHTVNTIRTQDPGAQWNPKKY